MNKRNQNQIDKIGLIIYHLNKRRRENQRNEKAKKCSCSGNYVPQNTDLDKYFAEFFSEILKINHGPITISISDICEQELSFKKDTFINIIYKVYFINIISHVARRLLGRKKKKVLNFLRWSQAYWAKKGSKILPEIRIRAWHKDIPKSGLWSSMSAKQGFRIAR